MPKVYRVMIKDEDKPEIGVERNMLGARPDEIKTGEVSGLTQDKPGGVSVFRCPCRIHPLVLPRRLRDRYRGAQGSNDRFVWSMGIGIFEDGLVTTELCLRTEGHHGVIEPVSPVTVHQYNVALSQTADSWIIDEHHNELCNRRTS